MAEADDVRGLARDLQEVKVLVARLGTMKENSEKRIDTLTGVAQEAVNGINRLGERMTATVGMEKDIGAMRDAFTELKGDTRALRHDMNNVMNSITMIAQVNDKLNEATSTIAAQGAKIEGMESWRDKMDGAGIAGLPKRVEELEKKNSNLDGAGITGLLKRVDDLEKKNINDDGKMTAIAGTAKTFWSVFSTPIWAAVTGVAVWILTQMYGGKGPFGGQ